MGEVSLDIEILSGKNVGKRHQKMEPWRREDCIGDKYRYTVHQYFGVPRKQSFKSTRSERVELYDATCSDAGNLTNRGAQLLIDGLV